MTNRVGIEPMGAFLVTKRAGVTKCAGTRSHIFLAYFPLNCWYFFIYSNNFPLTLVWREHKVKKSTKWLQIIAVILKGCSTDPFHLNLRACATDWRWEEVRGNASAGFLAECIAGTSGSETLASHGDKMGGKDHCRVTIGRIKARNSVERLSVYFTVYFYNQYYSV